MHKSFRFWLAIGISVVFLGIFLSRLDLRETWELMGEANYLLIIPAVLVYFGSVYFRTLRWQYLMAPVKRLSVPRLYPVVVVGYMANNILPVRLGEVVRAYYVGEREKVSKVSALATIAVERVFDGLTLLFFAAVVGLFLPIVGLLQGPGGGGGYTLDSAGPGHVHALRRGAYVHGGGSDVADLVRGPAGQDDGPAARPHQGQGEGAGQRVHRRPCVPEGPPTPGERCSCSPCPCG